MIDRLKRNIATEIEMLRELSNYNNKLLGANKNDAAQLEKAISSMKASMKMINNAFPDLLNSLDYGNKLPSTKDSNLSDIGFKRPDADISVSLQVRDRDKFLSELSINENIIRKLKKKQVITKEVNEDFKAVRGYLKISNRFFLDTALGYIKRGYFRNLYFDIKKANFDMLFETYIAMILFTCLLSFIISFPIMIFFLFFNLGASFPFISTFSGDLLFRFLKVMAIPVVLPIATFLALYYYPSTEKDSISKRIESELPFAVIHMSAISGSGISPSDVFKIIAMSTEYPNLKKEIRKVLNQINIYGYDLVTALTNVSKSTPSGKLAELFNGMSTTINSGGDLSEFFEKRAETLLSVYRLEREKFTKIAETFMDIYISVVIAAPMILMLLLVMITVTGIDIGFTTTTLSILMILGIAIINVLFLAFLQVKQPKY